MTESQGQRGLRKETAAKETGTRVLHRPLRVPAWDGNPNADVSPAALLFDVAYAASLSHHARAATLAPPSISSAVLRLYAITATATVHKWWLTSLFLARFDSGDLLGELVLVLYMVLVLGQSLSVQPCASCLYAFAQHGDCSDVGRNFWCDSPDGGGTDELPRTCRAYAAFAVAPRIVLIGSLVRAYVQAQPRARRDLAIQLCEQALLAPLWLCSVLTASISVGLASFAVAVVLELLFVFEPLHALHGALARRNLVSAAALDLIPVDARYVERRWHRLLMIALALLPNFSHRDVGLSAFAEDVVFAYNAGGMPRKLAAVSWFILFTCIFAYSIKVSYFDLTDPEAPERVMRMQLRSVRVFDESTTQLGALRYARLRGQLWLVCHLFLVITIAVLGSALNSLLDPWSGFPEAERIVVMQVRFFIAGPIALVLVITAVLQSLTGGAGRGRRRIGRSYRLLLRVVVAAAIACLPLLALTEPEGAPLPCGSNATAEGALNNLPWWSGFSLESNVWRTPMDPKQHAGLASRAFFLLTTSALLFAQLALELYGRQLRRESSGGQDDGAERPDESLELSRVRP